MTVPIKNKVAFSCRICESTIIGFQLNFGNYPIVHELYKIITKCATYPFHLVSCKNCGFIQILDPIPAKILYKNYFTISSWKNQPHIPRLVEVIEGLSLINKNSKIIDVGCNDGSFLNFLKNKGYTNLSGVEPTSDAWKIASLSGLNVVNEFLTESLANSEFLSESYDLITTRQVLEHIIDLDDFIRSLKYLLKKDGTLVIEIPDSELNLDFLDYALWEEHVNYFTLSTVTNLLKKHGFIIIHHEITLFSGRALTIFCQKNNSPSSPLLPVYRNIDEIKIANYFTNFENYKLALHGFLKKITQPIAIYGCGARSSNFVNFNAISPFISCFIDDQIEKANLFVPGCDLKITHYDRSIHKNYYILLGVNTENEKKIIIKNNLDVNSLASILPPSFLLPDFWKRLINKVF
jgi:2-polyprenyl-3-methyl-5-hydroxy-6-metoxy-1,4-benzoquinol methylase